MSLACSKYLQYPEERTELTCCDWLLQIEVRLFLLVQEWGELLAVKL